ncbi:MAG: HNH endonuclease, partial [Deltaproteobacteria bacterium]|nr:HNH endonuclease [Deltaproteobacteria bacterium]
MPCHPARARQLMRKGRAAVYRRYPFTIIIKEREGGDTQPTALKFD